MSTFRTVLGYILLSLLCSTASVLIVEFVATRGVEVDIGSGPVEQIADQAEYERRLSEHQARTEEYKRNYRRDQSTWIKRHHSYNPHALFFSWFPWILPALVWKRKRWLELFALLPVPISLLISGVFIVPELIVFSSVTGLTCLL